MNKETVALTQLEKRRARRRAYYWAHREEMRRQQKERYQSIDKAVHAARVRKYRQTHREQCLAAQRAYRAKNREHIREMRRRYREENRDKIRAAQREYWYANRERLLEEKRAYYQANRYRICRNKLEHDCFRSMAAVQTQCRERVERYMERWPFEQFADGRIKGQLRRWGIYPQNKLYGDCYDAGMLAYLYSVHRCALMEYLYVEQYIAKMIRILVICALNVGREAEHLCQVNGFRLCLLDSRRE